MPQGMSRSNLNMYPLEFIQTRMAALKTDLKPIPFSPMLSAESTFVLSPTLQMASMFLGLNPVSFEVMRR